MKRSRGSTPQNLRRKDPKNEQRAKNTQRHRRRRKRSRAVFAALILLFIVAVILTLSLTVFFKTEKIDIVGETQYSNEEIIACTGVKVGDNLFGISAGDVQNRILKNFLNIDTVQVTKNLPGTLTIKLTAAVANSAFQNAGTYYTTSQSCRVLAVGSSQPDGVPLVVGADIDGSPQQGDILVIKNTSISEYIKAIMDEMGQYGLSGLNSIDVSNLSRIKADYQGRIVIQFGDTTQLQYKAQLAFYVIKNNIQASEKGTVDATTIGEVHFLPDRQ